MRTVVTGILLLAAGMAAWAAEEPKLTQGDYAIRLTPDGLEATWKGVPFLCATHFSIAKPEWKGTYYAGDNLLGHHVARGRIVAGPNVVSVDAYGLTLARFNGKQLTVADAPFLQRAARAGLGVVDLAKLTVKKISV